MRSWVNKIGIEKRFQSRVFGATSSGVFSKGGKLGAAKRQTGRVQKLIENGEKAVERTEKELCLGRCGKSPLWMGKKCSAEAGRIPLVCVEPCPIFWDAALASGS